MKKATSKRERKYGKKKNDEPIKEAKKEPVKVIVDYGTVVKFKNLKLAEIFVDKLRKDAEKNGHQPPSCIII